MITLIAYLTMDYFDNHGALIYVLPILFDLVLLVRLNPDD